MKLLKNFVFYISIISLSVVPFIFTKYNKPSSFNTPVLEVKEEDVDEKYIAQYSSDFSKALEQTGLDTGIINEINNSRNMGQIYFESIERNKNLVCEYVVC
ncbi:MAG: hypothetical protein Ta2E_08410 [Mycoplasmoidaceae bacterium]|nr:MAG: hypothetical protein Ta2E_08410 [Mycoplasmoidaceae bacterium]